MSEQATLQSIARSGHTGRIFLICRRLGAHTCRKPIQACFRSARGYRKAETRPPPVPLQGRCRHAPLGRLRGHRRQPDQHRACRGGANRPLSPPRHHHQLYRLRRSHPAGFALPGTIDHNAANANFAPESSAPPPATRRWAATASRGGWGGGSRGLRTVTWMGLNARDPTLTAGGIP
jgi:hypothetical protein